VSPFLRQHQAKGGFFFFFFFFFFPFVFFFSYNEFFHFLLRPPLCILRALPERKTTSPLSFGVIPPSLILAGFFFLLYGECVEDPFSPTNGGFLITPFPSTLRPVFRDYPMSFKPTVSFRYGPPESLTSFFPPPQHCWCTPSPTLAFPRGLVRMFAFLNTGHENLFF